MDQNFRAPREKLVALVVDILNTPQARNAVIEVGRAWIQDRSRNRWTQGLGSVAAWVLAKTLSASDRDGDLAAVFEKPDHIEALAGEIPRLRDGVSSIGRSVAQALEQMPDDRKKAMFDRLFSEPRTPAAGGMLPSLVRTVQAIYKDDPTFFSARMLPLVEQWVVQTDFGEVRALFEASKADLAALGRGVGDITSEYPAKLVAVLSMLPGAVNLVLDVVAHLLEQYNAMPPDILTDLLLTMVREVDAEALGGIFTRLNELVRQLHTGSTLIGEMDAPQFTSDLKEKIRAFMTVIDPALTIKARAALIDGRETVIGALIEAAEERPELLNLWLGQLTAQRNSDIRLLKRKIEVLENLPEDDAVSALSAGLSVWNAYDLAETVNVVSRMLNRMQAYKPGILAALVTEFVQSLDHSELEETLDWLCRDLGKAVRPVFRMAAPFMVRELCGWFEADADDDGRDAAMRETRDRLRRLFLSEEVKP